MSSKTVAIAGGGIAGLTCAKYLVDVGIRVIIVEAEPLLGGRASTFRDRDGEWIEQGLHLFLGAYSEFRKLLAEIGRPAEETLFWTDKVHLQDPEGPQATYGTNPLYAPLTTLLSALTQNDYLGILDKLSALPLAAPAIASLETIRRNYDGLTVTEWWRKVSGREEVLERLLRPLCRAIQFSEPEQFSAYDFLGWAHNSIYDLPNLRLAGYVGARDESIFAPWGRYLTDRGAQIRVNTPILEISYQPTTNRIRGLMLPSGERIEADAYVAAMPAWVLPSLLPPSLLGQHFFTRIESLPTAPAISVQLWFDRPIAENPEFHLVARSPACVYQEQSPHTYPAVNGNRVSVIVSPADDLLDWTNEALVTLTVGALRSANPKAVAARLRKSVVLKHRKHLVRPLPGAMSARPPQLTPTPGLFLAGDWTQQEFFGSQEGAVRGGKYCAREIRRQLLPEAPELD